MKRLTFPLLFFVVWLLPSSGVSAAQVSLTLAVASKSVLLEEPAAVTVTLKNESACALKLPFMPGGDVMGPWSDVPGVLVAEPAGKPSYCLQEGRTITADFSWKMEDSAILTPPGKSIAFHIILNLPPPFSRTPGAYELHASYVARGRVLTQVQIAGESPYYACEGCWKGIVDSTPVTITVETPTGIDAQAYQAFKGHPLKHPAELLKRFPTSTYAGYALAHKSAGLSMEALFCLDDPYKILNRWADRGGGDSNTQAHIKEAQDAMRNYAKLAGPFLEAHPDFFYAPLIRRQYAMCLGFTGDIPEAMNQISTLAKGKGKEADEAKAYLAEKESKKAKNR